MLRLLALLGSLSLATDLGTGAPLEESLKRCVVATRLARLLGCAEDEVRDVVYVSLLQHVGCTAYGHEFGRLWGDDIGVNRMGLLTYFADPKDAVRTFMPGMAVRTGTSRVRAYAKGIVFGSRAGARAQRATCEVARSAARRLGLSQRVADSLFQTQAWWNGGGYPHVVGDGLALAMRITHVAHTAVLFHMYEGPDRAVAEVGRRSGGYLDPAIVSTFRTHGRRLLDDLTGIDTYQCVLDAEPDPVRRVAEPAVEEVARVFGDLVDLKTPALHGHSAGVAALAARASRELGFDDGSARILRIAGHLHDLGRVSVPSGVWDKPGPLTAAERDQVRLHPYYSERILARVPGLEEAATLAGRHHERCDGSGYHRGVTGAQLSMPARLLATADAYRALVEQRPYRRALPAPRAADALRAKASAGALDGDAVAAVLAASGQRAGVRRPRPAGLTERQVEVLKLMACGLSNRAIADRLVISRRTAEHHAQDIYVKIGASTRAAAALYAMEHGLYEKPG